MHSFVECLAECSRLPKRRFPGPVIKDGGCTNIIEKPLNECKTPNFKCMSSTKVHAWSLLNFEKQYMYTRYDNRHCYMAEENPEPWLIQFTWINFCVNQGWQSIDRQRKPGLERENPGFPGLGNTPWNGSPGQYWVIRFFYSFLSWNTGKLCIIVLSDS